MGEEIKGSFRLKIDPADLSSKVGFELERRHI